MPTTADTYNCAKPMAKEQPRVVISQMALEHGWTVRRFKIGMGCDRLDALGTRAANSARVLVRITPATLASLDIETRHH